MIPSWICADCREQLSVIGWETRPHGDRIMISDRARVLGSILDRKGKIGKKPSCPHDTARLGEVFPFSYKKEVAQQKVNCSLMRLSFGQVGYAGKKAS